MDTESIEPEVTYELFTKVDVRVGTVTKASNLGKSDKLLLLEVDFGALGSRQIVAGIAKSYMPESMVGRRVLGVVNLVPRKVFGVESHGMVLAAVSASGESLLLADCPGAPNGARIG